MLCSLFLSSEHLSHVGHFVAQALNWRVWRGLHLSLPDEILGFLHKLDLNRSSGVAFAEELLTLYWVKTQSPVSLFHLKKMAVAGVILRCDVTTLFFCWVGGGGDVGSGQWSPPTRHYGSWGRGRGSPRLGVSWRGAKKTFFGCVVFDARGRFTSIPDIN